MSDLTNDSSTNPFSRWARIHDLNERKKIVETHFGPYSIRVNRPQSSFEDLRSCARDLLATEGLKFVVYRTEEGYAIAREPNNMHLDVTYATASHSFEISPAPSSIACSVVRNNGCVNVTLHDQTLKLILPSLFDKGIELKVD